MADEAVYDPEDLDLDEMEMVEEITGEPFLVSLTKLNAKFFKALVYTFERRDNPEYTVEMAGKVKVGSVMSARPGAPAKKPRAA